MRPIYHWTPRRIRAHSLICYIAYSALTFIKFQLKQKNIDLISSASGLVSKNRLQGILKP